MTGLWTLRNGNLVCVVKTPNKDLMSDGLQLGQIPPTVLQGLLSKVG